MVKQFLVLTSISLVMLTSACSLAFIVYQIFSRQLTLEHAFQEFIITTMQSYFLPLLIFICFHDMFIKKSKQIEIASGYIAGVVCTWWFVAIGHGFPWFAIAVLASINVPIFGTVILIAKGAVQLK
jgi:positive regulator of sigma E activity